jgi:catechol 2,3-dioxygenase-like lactoylglutathione lyase family enzyme
VITVFFEGKMRALFGMLFGAGVLLFVMKKEQTGKPLHGLFYRRMFWLVLFGLFHAHVILWMGDILYLYGVCGMLVYLFRNMKPKYLVWGVPLVAVLGFVAGTLFYQDIRAKRIAYVEAVKAQSQNQTLTEAQTKALATWREIELTMIPNHEDAKKNTEKMKSGYSTVASRVRPLAFEGQTKFLPLAIPDSLALMLLGLALFKWGFLTGAWSKQDYWKVAKPAKFAHVVYQTRRFEEMVDWYQKVFEANVVYQNPALAFLTYDDEHHRFAFINMAAFKPDGADTGARSDAGVNHTAYTYANLGDLLDTYERLKQAGIAPYWPIHHGMTLSLYYQDPDGNRMEFQLDTCTVAAANAYMSIGTDPRSALTTRRGTGYYKVPSLKGVWYRGPFEHNGSVATLEDWFDPKRLQGDYVPMRIVAVLLLYPACRWFADLKKRRKEVWLSYL